MKYLALYIPYRAMLIYVSIFQHTVLITCACQRPIHISAVPCPTDQPRSRYKTNAPSRTHFLSGDLQLVSLMSSTDFPIA